MATAMHPKIGTRTTLAWAAIVAVALIGLTAAADAASNRDRTAAKRGAHWIAANYSRFATTGTGNRADAVSALAAGRRHKLGIRQTSVDRFAQSVASEAIGYASTPGAIGKLMLAAAAAGDDPGCYGPRGAGILDKINLIAALGSPRKGRYGTTSFDQAFAMLGLAAAHRKVPRSAVKFVKQRRGKYGWGFALGRGPGDDVDSTSLLIQALRAAGVSKRDKSLRAAFTWLRAQRVGGGFAAPGGTAGVPQSNSTASAMMAADSLGVHDTRAAQTLRKLQSHKQGFFYSTGRSSPEERGAPQLSTVDAVTALAGEHLPVRKLAKAGTQCNL